uniref:hypothetical protein n=1 Tax=Alloprevotella sp. TaxID=1872471 RepID=UPI00402721C3
MSFTKTPLKQLASRSAPPHYKRGTIRKDGKLYGRYPDGSLYRIYSTSDRPFLQLVDVGGKTFLRIHQATELGYTDCPCPGAADLSYQSSALRRSRTVGGGELVNALPAASGRICVFVEL